MDRGGHHPALCWRILREFRVSGARHRRVFMRLNFGNASHNVKAQGLIRRSRRPVTAADLGAVMRIAHQIGEWRERRTGWTTERLAHPGW